MHRQRSPAVTPCRTRRTRRHPAHPGAPRDRRTRVPSHPRTSIAHRPQPHLSHRRGRSRTSPADHLVTGSGAARVPRGTWDRHHLLDHQRRRAPSRPVARGRDDSAEMCGARPGRTPGRMVVRPYRPRASVVCEPRSPRARRSSPPPRIRVPEINPRAGNRAALSPKRCPARLMRPVVTLAGARRVRTGLRAERAIGAALRA